ncbi:hypothetical protein GGS23DRAFT_614788 [Durotheca rogersii]|uniref:uncharacterized protein n=1 Tax=Durotheca rogersii TaxID=419775 RepID=UPI00221E472A|nr:uncharacterized protein GGS23DRAFT_614788 [Durotheca rogersii]KAI5859758.1 hypothetical protein GGS23DRAFT_614788 [Durotheca rogersii]
MASSPVARQQQRRKASARSKAAAPQPQHASASISSFARVSKTTTARTDSKKQDPASSSPTPATPAATTTTRTSTRRKTSATAALEPITPASRKRKAATRPSEVEDSLSADEGTPKRTATAAAAPALRAPTTAPLQLPSQPAKRGRGRPPKKPRHVAPLAAIPTTTISVPPRKRARSPTPSASIASESDDASALLFKKLRLESSPASTRFSSSLSSFSGDSCAPPPTTPDTPVSDADSGGARSRARALPPAVAALVDLHAALLRTLSLHAAHAGAGAPADLRALRADAARAWGRRAVSADDVRACLGVLLAADTTAAPPLLELVDYGPGKVCLEIRAAAEDGAAARAVPRPPLREAELKAAFAAEVRARWSRWCAEEAGERDEDEDEEGDARAFLAALPRAPVTICESVAKAAPVLDAGRRRLDALRGGLEAKRAAKLRPPTGGARERKLGQGPGPEPPQQQQEEKEQKQEPQQQPQPKLSLLDRLRAKAQQKAAGAGAGQLTAAQAARRAALQRAPAVGAVLGMLGRAEGSGFAMAAVVQRLRDSAPGGAGLARDDAAACVRLLAAEVAPAWVRVVRLPGRPEAVVLDPAAEVGARELRERVEGLLARLQREGR